MSLSITWLGHGTFLLVSPGGKRLVIDPWLVGNPSCPAEFKRIDTADLILVTHGHFDHIEDAVSVARATGAPLIANYEVCAWLESKGLRDVLPMNLGGTARVAGIRITMVPALHSSTYMKDGRLIPLGHPCGYVLRFENDLVAYFAGDTCLFGDMRLIRDIHAPAIAFLPIGDLFTMGPDAAARAAEMLGVKQVVPMHYGTFPMLTGTPAMLRESLGSSGIDVLELEPGQTAR